MRSLSPELICSTPSPWVFRTLLSALLVSSVGCGAKTGLITPPPPDAGVDAPADAPVDVPVDVPMDVTPDVIIPDPDLCIELPPREPPQFIDTEFEARISTADVLFLVDVTGSMTEEIAQIRRTLRDTIAPELTRSIPDVQLSVAEFADFPVVPYGDASADTPFQIRQTSTSDLAAAQIGVSALRERSGSDVPESHVEALWQVATGSGAGMFVPPQRGCPEGTIGYPCFRAAGSRIVLLFTDAEFHNGPGGSNPYDSPPIRPAPATYAQAVGALQSIGAKVLGLYSGGLVADRALTDLEAIARDTGAVTESGEPIVVDIGRSGEALGTGVIDVVRTLVEDVPIDIDVLLEDGPGDAVDATEFVVGVETLGASPPEGAIELGDRYESVRPGTRVRFRVVLRNDAFELGPEPQSFFLTVVLRGDGVVRLRETLVEIVIPSVRGEGCLGDR